MTLQHSRGPTEKNLTQTKDFLGLIQGNSYSLFEKMSNMDARYQIDEMKMRMSSNLIVVRPNYSLEKRDNEEFTAQMLIEIADRMNRLMSVSDFLSEECVNDVKYLRDARNKVTESQRRKVDDLLATLGVTKLFHKIWKKYFIMDFLRAQNSLMKNLMNGILWALCNSMARSTALCVQVFESDLHTVILSFLKSVYLDPSKTVDPNREDVAYGLMAIIHNMLQKASESSQSLREQKAFDLLQRFRRSPSNKISCMAFILQSYMITEEENELVNSDDSNFRYLKRLLEWALMPNNYRRRADGFAPTVVISALNRLAVNDNNKTRIVNVGLLPYYVELLQPECSEEEKEAAAEGLWTLAFKCPREIENEPGCVAALKKLAKVNFGPLSRLAKGVLWTLEESKRRRTSCGQILRSGQYDQRHVFISYQWDSKPMIKKLVSSLEKEGFQIWVDFNNMAGSILEAMAKAVEEAAVVVLCLSQKYKESPNCRTEAEYTFRQSKDILPLRLQSSYWPDGWLGAMIGNRLMHDFTSDMDYSESIKNVIRELGERGKTAEYKGDEPDFNVDIVKKGSVSTFGYSHVRISKYAFWTSEEIASWLKDNKLEKFQYWFKDYNGNLLIEYKAMLEKAPEAFYSVLKQTFSQKDMLKLSMALKQL